MQRKLNLNDLVFIGIKGTVLALDGETGDEVWRTKLKGYEFTNLTLTREGDRLLAGVRGEVFCIDAVTGALLWHNPLKGMGFGLLTFATAPQISASAARIRAEQAAAGSAVVVTS